MTDLNVPAYLRRLGLAHPGPPSVVGLRALHTAHVERIPYEALDIQLGRLTSIEPAGAAARITRHGRGGYCYHLNGAFWLLLRALGYDAVRHRAAVQPRDADASPGIAWANHLALTVHGLPDDDCPGGDRLVDVGLGDAMHEPLPLRAGEYVQGPMRLRLRPSELAPGGWRLDHDPAGTFTGMDLEAAPAHTGAFLTRHRHLSTSPESGFVRTCAVLRRDATGVDVLTGCVLRRVGGTARPVALETKADWYGALADVFGLMPAELDTADRDRLWTRVRAAHETWLART